MEKAINIVCRTSPTAGPGSEFVEIETDDGCSICIGAFSPPDEHGFYKIRITPEDIVRATTDPEALRRIDTSALLLEHKPLPPKVQAFNHIKEALALIGDMSFSSIADLDDEELKFLRRTRKVLNSVISSHCHGPCM